MDLLADGRQANDQQAERIKLRAAERKVRHVEVLWDGL
jgi:hypothetical protein